MMRQTAILRVALLVAPLLLAACSGGGSDGGETGGTGNGSVSLNWQAPTRNADGSSLTDLTGYKVYYGPSSNGLKYWERISAAQTSHRITGLTSGTWLFSVTAVKATGHESLFSNEAIAVID